MFMIESLLYPLVCERFRSDVRYREGHLRVVNALPQRRVLGLHIPQMRQVARLIDKEGLQGESLPGDRDVIALFESVPDASLCYEEIVIWGFLINMRKCGLEERLAMLERYIPVLDNWAVCDSFCADAKWMAVADRGMLWGFLQRWFDSGREFEVRFAVVTSMIYFLTEDWLCKVFQRIESIDIGWVRSDYRSVKGRSEVPQQGTVQGTEPYYVRMGIAWLLATALAKFPEQTRKFVASSKLPEDVMKLYIRKARESFRTREISPKL